MSHRLHALLDYVTVVGFALAPTLFSLSAAASVGAYALAVVHLLLTVITDFAGGAFRWVPLSLHGKIELAVALVLPLLAWLGSNILNASDRVFFGAAGALILIVYLLSDYKPSGAGRKLPL
jgi:hypothetical protein